jgi:hypothetical protein
MQIQLCRWRYFDVIRGHTVTTGCVFSAESALTQWPDAVPVPGTQQTREVPDIEDEVRNRPRATVEPLRTEV